MHGIINAEAVPDITDEIFDLGIFIEMPHIILFLFITAENPYFSYISIQKRRKTAFRKILFPLLSGAFFR
jgi:hypothetical protein